jgi:hypothetical protein
MVEGYTYCPGCGDWPASGNCCTRGGVESYFGRLRWAKRNGYINRTGGAAAAALLRYRSSSDLCFCLMPYSVLLRLHPRPECNQPSRLDQRYSPIGDGEAQAGLPGDRRCPLSPPPPPPRGITLRPLSAAITFLICDHISLCPSRLPCAISPRVQVCSCTAMPPESVSPTPRTTPHPRRTLPLST